jgi:hypothetical protein
LSFLLKNSSCCIAGISPSSQEERGDSALCIHSLWEYTSNAFIGIARPDHTDLFSCEWITSSQPCISPFLPVYIGVNEIPKAMTTCKKMLKFLGDLPLLGKSGKTNPV